MKKFLMILMLSSVVFASQDFIVDNSKFKCVIAGEADSQWKSTTNYSSPKMKSSMFWFKKSNDIVVDNAGVKFSYIGTETSKNEVYMDSKSNTVLIVTARNTKVGGIMTMGLQLKDFGDKTMNNYKAVCKRIN